MREGAERENTGNAVNAPAELNLAAAFWDKEGLLVCVMDHEGGAAFGDAYNPQTAAEYLMELVKVIGKSMEDAQGEENA